MLCPRFLHAPHVQAKFYDLPDQLEGMLEKKFKYYFSKNVFAGCLVVIVAVLATGGYVGSLLESSGLNSFIPGNFVSPLGLGRWICEKERNSLVVVADIQRDDDRARALEEACQHVASGNALCSHRFRGVLPWKICPLSHNMGGGRRSCNALVILLKPRLPSRGTRLCCVRFVFPPSWCTVTSDATTNV